MAIDLDALIASVVSTTPEPTKPEAPESHDCRDWLAPVIDKGKKLGHICGVCGTGALFDGAQLSRRAS